MCADTFRYRVLLVDDLEDARDREDEFRNAGVDFHAASGVDDCLRRFLNADVDNNADFEKDIVEHDFDIVLLDFQLAREMGQYPIGGLSLYPLFVHGYNGAKPGECVVCAYSAYLGEQYPKYCRLFQKGELTRTGHPEVYQSAAFGGFRLYPLFRQRAESILRQLGPAAIMEAYNVFVDEEKGLDGALRHKLEIASEALGVEVSLRNLCPDFNQPVFFPGNSCPSEQEQQSRLYEWLSQLVSRYNFAWEAYQVYNHRGSVPDVHQWGHYPNDQSKNDPREYWKPEEGYVLQLGSRKRKLHNAHVQALLTVPRSSEEFTKKDRIARCSKVHRAFRLSLTDNSRTREGFNSYDEGYFLRDFQEEDEISIEPLSLEETKERYVFVPKIELSNMMKELSFHLGKGTDTRWRVTLQEDQQIACFHFKLANPFTKEKVKQCARANWLALKTIPNWGELVMFIPEGKYVLAGGRVLSEPQRFGKYTIPENSLCLIFRTIFRMEI